jgi:hypothetical protein
MKPYNIDRAKDLNDQLIHVKNARNILQGDCHLIVKHDGGDVLITISAGEAKGILDDKEADLKKRLIAIGVEID